ncbi:MAG: thymidine kinase [Planctomycetota bacterium]
MAKLYFRYGAVGSAKSLNLLAVAHNYERQGKRVVVVKPSFDTRFGEFEVASRAGLSRQADLLVDDHTQLDFERFAGVQCVLVDEAQFLSASVVDQLRDVAHRLRIPVICYGLRTDFRTRAFPGSLRLLELADAIEEVKTTCAFCNSKAIFNLKHLNGEATLAGPSKQLGAEETFFGVCSRHYVEQLDLDGFEALAKSEALDETP